MYYAFDHELTAKSVMKERLVWMLYIGIIFFLLYGVANHYAGLTAPHPTLNFGWEDKIPFIPEFIVPYMSSDVMFICAFLFPYTRLELRVLAERVLFIILTAVVLFTFFPFQFAFEKPATTESFSFLFGVLQADLPYNQAPSLHISFAIVLWYSMREYLTLWWVKVLVATWIWLIVLSTLFVFQHHILDLPTGAALGFFTLYFINAEKDSILTRSFTTPRSLKMGLYYLIASAFFLILSVNIGTFSWLAFWFFLSLFSVSIIYAFGLNALLAGKEAKASWWQWLLFAPYFVGNYLSWQYYKRKLPLMQALKDNVYLGRYPSAKEYSILEEKGICLALNLATEQQVQKKGLAQIRLPFLDQTIQSPESLHQGVEYIEAHKEDGVYVHCTLGLSRSVLLTSAWLLFNGYSLNEAQEEIAKIRPNAVKSPYMQITLEIYQKYLNELNAT
jgi:protein-tyrosine phosphatase/membrane-associated phospholipid phosphatase